MLKIKQILMHKIFIIEMKNDMIKFNKFKFIMLFFICLNNITCSKADNEIDSAIKHHKNGNYEQAINIYTKIINTNPEQSELYFNRGLAYSESSLYQKALNDFNQCLLLDVENDACYFNRSIVKFELGDSSGALNDLNQTIELVPRDAKALFNRAIIKYKLRDVAGAIKDAKESKRLWKSIKYKKEYQQVNEFLNSIL